MERLVLSDRALAQLAELSPLWFWTWSNDATVTPYFLQMLVLLSAAEAMCCVFPGKRAGYALLCGFGMLGFALLTAPDALSLARLSNQVVPGVNLGICFLGLPLAALIKLCTKKSENVENTS